MTTHRLRLYRLQKDFLPGKDLITEVWDTEETPETSPELPLAEQLVASFSNASESVVREQANRHRRENGCYVRGSWNSRGMI